MDLFVKAAAFVLISVILSLFLSKQNKEISILLVILVCCIVITMSVTFLKPVISFINKLSDTANLDSELLVILLKAVGVGIITEICVLVSADSGNQTLGKSLQIMSTGVILWLALPIMEEMLELLKNILESV